MHSYSHTNETGNVFEMYTLEILLSAHFKEITRGGIFTNQSSKGQKDRQRALTHLATELDF